MFQIAGIYAEEELFEKQCHANVDCMKPEKSGGIKTGKNPGFLGIMEFRSEGRGIELRQGK